MPQRRALTRVRWASPLNSAAAWPTSAKAPSTGRIFTLIQPKPASSTIYSKTTSQNQPSTTPRPATTTFTPCNFDSPLQGCSMLHPCQARFLQGAPRHASAQMENHASAARRRLDSAGRRRRAPAIFHLEAALQRQRSHRLETPRPPPHPPRIPPHSHTCPHDPSPLHPPH